MEHKQDVGHHELQIGAGEQQFDDTEEGVTFFHDFVAGGVAGSASVIVGHPFDTLKVRVQTATSRMSLLSFATSYGGFGSLFRGMGAPLASASVINAIIFSTFGWSSRIYDDYFENAKVKVGSNGDQDSSFKALTCGSFAGLVQALIICPTEHIKCRLQVQTGATADGQYKGPVQAARAIAAGHGISGLYRAWWCTVWREVPAFGLYFSGYDFCKDKINSFFAKQAGMDDPSGNMQHSHTWVASGLAGGCTGALTWAVIYPFDIIKTRIQTAPLDTPLEERRILAVAKDIIQNHGVRHLFRGVNITVIRAFPVNGIIFPVYEYVLMKITELEHN